MLKTPVSILQELMVQKKLAPPDYMLSGAGQPHQMNFLCTVQSGDNIATGTGSTKKDAKHNAAQNLLKMFGIDLDTGATSSEISSRKAPSIAHLPLNTTKLNNTPNVNFIGKLNEFAAARRYPMPIYTDDDHLHGNQFGVICKFADYSAEGYGNNKKNAKQESAKKMLEILNEQQVECRDQETVKKLEVNKEVADQVIEKYTSLLKDIHLSAKDQNSNDLNLCNNNVNVSTWKEMELLFSKLQYKYELVIFQQSPLIYVLKINEYFLMHHGADKKEILEKFVETVVNMIREGNDFTRPILYVPTVRK